MHSVTLQRGWAFLFFLCLMLWPLADMRQALAESERVVLFAGFDDKTPGQPIGTGGAAVGEPIQVPLSQVLEAQVVQAGGDNNALRLTRLSMTGGVYVRFQFLDNIEIRRGVVTISLELRPRARSSHAVVIREAQSSTGIFLTLVLGADGSISARDAASGGNYHAVAEDAYDAGETIEITLQFDMDARTGSAWVSTLRDPLYLDRAHGVAAARGVGSVLIGFPVGGNEEPFQVDNLIVMHRQPSEVFTDGFE